MMRQTYRIALCLLALFGLASGAAFSAHAQDPVYRVEVDLVQLTVAVTDGHGHYIQGLRPLDFRIFEDGIPQKISMFSQAGARPERVADVQGASTPSLPAELSGSNIFVLFDTSNMMYRNLVYAQDAITNFVRGLDPQDSVAVYSFSRNLLRAQTLTADRGKALASVRQVVAGDDTALYNTLLLTVQDAARVPGRKVIVVFSNGPDNGSMVSPETVRETAENEGIPIYIISTQDATRDDISSAAFQRLSSRTGGKNYFARTWQKQAEAFAAIRNDLQHLYVLSYYPAPNDNLSWRSITVELMGESAKKYRIRTRTGYRPKVHQQAESLNAPLAKTASADNR